MKRSLSSIAKHNSSALLSPLKPTLVFTVPSSSSSLKSIIHNLKSTSFSGFTIIELLVVISVIGILAAITLVSYSGVSTRATIATMQSDLSNASTALRLDHATTDSFPASLALANNGRGIAPSQSMDDIIYVPDNSSNPKNFCLQYRKGTNTYAVDANTQPVKGACLKNIITNGDFSGGATVWWTSGGTGTVANNVYYVTGNGTSSYPYLGQTINNSAISGHKYYFSFKTRVTNSSATQLYLRTNITNQVDTYIGGLVVNQWYPFSVVGTSTSSGNINFYLWAQYADAATSNGKVMETQYVTSVDLTAIFGAGNEPTKATMDTLMSGYPNNWFNITAKANL